MKKAIFIFFLVFFVNHLYGQVSEYSSYQSAVLQKKPNGKFPIPNEWISKKMTIILDLDRKKLNVWSADFSGEDDSTPENEIQLYKVSSKSRDGGQKGVATFTGTDKSGERCIVRFNYLKKADDIYDGLLQIEYPDTQYLYKLRKEKT